MFARLLELTVKAEKKPELFNKIKQDVIPILRKYAGFTDIINMEVEGDPTKVYLISLWNQKSDAEKYDKENFPKVKAMYEPFLTTPIVMKLCKVVDTTFKIVSVAA